MQQFYRPKRRKIRGKLSSVYSVQVYDLITGKRSWRSTGAETFSEALEVKKGWENEGEIPERQTTDRGMKLKTAMDLYLETRSNASAHCMKVYKAIGNKFTEAFKNRGLKTIRAHDLDLYISKRAKSVSKRTLNNDRAFLRRFFRYCENHQWIDHNPATELRGARLPRRNIRTLEEKDETRLLKECKKSGGSTYGFVLILMHSGLRRGAVAGLEWSHIDFERGWWSIPGGIMKSGEDFHAPINAELLEWLRQNRKPAGLVVGPLEAKRWKTATEAAGLAELRPHDLRRSFVTKCRRKGIAMEVTMALSDHRDLAVVLSVYRGVDSAELTSAMKVLEGKGKRPRKRKGARA